MSILDHFSKASSASDPNAALEPCLLPSDDDDAPTAQRPATTPAPARPSGPARPSAPRARRAGAGRVAAVSCAKASAACASMAEAHAGGVLHLCLSWQSAPPCDAVFPCDAKGISFNLYPPWSREEKQAKAEHDLSYNELLGLAGVADQVATALHEQAGAAVLVSDKTGTDFGRVVLAFAAFLLKGKSLKLAASELARAPRPKTEKYSAILKNEKVKSARSLEALQRALAEYYVCFGNDL